MAKINVEELNKQITSDDIKLILKSFGARTISENDEQIVFPSICHHKDFEHHKNKLYYYKNGSFFLCYSCSSSGDIYWLVQKRKELLGESCNFPQAIKYVCDIIGINCDDINIPKEEKKKDIYDWQSNLSKYIKNKSSDLTNKEYDSSILEYFPKLYHQSFIDDFITIETMEKFGVRFYPYKQQILLPVYSNDSKFIGCHCRNLLPELIDLGYKYIPLCLLDGSEYRFNTSNVLYGLNMNKMFIKQSKEVIIVEAPKGVMQLDSYGYNNGGGLFGRVLQKAKLKLLLKYECESFVIAIDKQYKKHYNEDGTETEEFIKYRKVVNKIIDMVKPYAKNIFVVWDYNDDKLDFKDSPMDKGYEAWKDLWENKERIEL